MVSPARLTAARAASSKLCSDVPTSSIALNAPPIVPPPPRGRCSRTFRAGCGNRRASSAAEHAPGGFVQLRVGCERGAPGDDGRPVELREAAARLGEDHAERRDVPRLAADGVAVQLHAPGGDQEVAEAVAPGAGEA